MISEVGSADLPWIPGPRDFHPGLIGKLAYESGNFCNDEQLTLSAHTA